MPDCIYEKASPADMPDVLDHANYVFSASSVPHDFAALLPKVADIRRTGRACMDLCDVAAGRSDGHFEWQLQPWDYCAATLLVEEAGGKCGNILGGPVTYDRGIPHIAASARIFDELQATLQQVWQVCK